MSKRRSRSRPRPSATSPGPRRARAVPIVVVGVALAALVFVIFRPGPAPLGDADLPTEPWNVLLVSLDTTRPDYLNACGEGSVPTPTLDRVRGDGFVFSSMITPAPITLPSHASLLTGTNPYRHGVRENTEYALPERATSLAETLAELGYRTQAFVSSFVMDERFGLAQGFEEYVDDLTGPGVSVGAVELPGEVSASRAADWISGHAAERRRGIDDRPFFVFLHLFDAHAPYAPPSPFRESYAANPYAGELAYQDACLGVVLDRLEAVGEASRTLIWVVSDHGESLGAHGEDTHSLFVYDVTQRAVSLLRLPPRDSRYLAKDPRGVVEDVTGLIDVYPTLLELLGHPGVESEGVEGRSLVPLLRGATDPERTVYCETYSPYVSYRWSPLLAVRSREWKYIRAPYPELYDLKNDPSEERNLASARPELVRSLSLRLDEFLAQGAEGGGSGTVAGSNAGMAGEGVADGPSGALAGDSRREASEEELARLRSLGYLGGSSEATAPPGDMSRLPDPKRQIAFFRQNFQTAKSLLLSGQVRPAIEKFEEALSVDPGNPSIHQFLGVAYRQSGEYDAAARAYRTALSLQPESSRAWIGIGRTHLARGLPDSAGIAFGEAMRLLPTSPDPWEGLGDVAWMRGDLVRASAYLDSARVKGAPPVLIEGKLARLFRDDLPDPLRAARHLEAYARALGTDTRTASSRLPKSPLE